jgi:hypothetical protein
MAFQHIVVAEHLRGKSVDLSLVSDGDTDERGNIFPDLLGVDNGLVPLDHPAGLEFFYSLHHGRCRKLDFVGYISQPGPTVILQNKKDF